MKLSALLGALLALGFAGGGLAATPPSCQTAAFKDLWPFRMAPTILLPSTANLTVDSAASIVFVAPAKPPAANAAPPDLKFRLFAQDAVKDAHGKSWRYDPAVVQDSI